jgi:TFIIF-interacting CTD phosphatase-like protein
MTGSRSKKGKKDDKKEDVDSIPPVLAPYRWSNKKAIVLDLDETLIATADDMSDLKEFNILYDPQYYNIRSRLYLLELEDAVDPPGTGVTSNMYGCYRPFVREFLFFCSMYFSKIIIWTAGKERYGKGLATLLFQGLPGPHDVLTWEDCHIEEDTKLVVKPLTKLYERHPDLNPTNTMVVDDRLTTFEKYNPHNAIHIPGYIPRFTPDYIENDPDRALRDLIFYLARKEVKEADDIRHLQKPAPDEWTLDGDYASDDSD